MTRKSLMRCCVVTAVIALSMLAGDGCRAEQKPWPLWQSYAKGFIDDQGRVIDHSGQDRTTSEAQAYAMFFALVANDQKEFDKLLLWTTQNLAQGDLTQHLPAWNWGKAADGQWKTLDPNPASDADLWMAYDLFQAGEHWGDRDYTKLATAMIEHIEKLEVVQLPPSCADGPLLLPAPVGFHPDDFTWVMNPSYIPLPLVEYFASTRHGLWSSMVQELPHFYNHTATAGYAPDWSKCDSRAGWSATAAPGQQPMQTQAGQAGANPAPATPQTANGAVPAATAPAAAGTVPAPVMAPVPAVGSFDAIRVYLWLGIADPKTPSLKLSLDELPGMAKYLSSESKPPLTVDAYGSVKNAQGPLGFSAAVAPYLEALKQDASANAQLNRLKAGLDAGTGLYGHPAYYYDQNMALFATGWVEKRYHFDKDGSLKLK
jgi:endoglucanase